MKEKLDKIELAQISIMNRLVSGMSKAIETGKTFENDRGMCMYERGVYDGYELAFNIILREFDDADLHEYAFGIDASSMDIWMKKAQRVVNFIYDRIDTENEYDLAPDLYDGSITAFSEIFDIDYNNFEDACTTARLFGYEKDGE